MTSLAGDACQRVLIVGEAQNPPAGTRIRIRHRYDVVALHLGMLQVFYEHEIAVYMADFDVFEDADSDLAPIEKLHGPADAQAVLVKEALLHYGACCRMSVVECFPRFFEALDSFFESDALLKRKLGKFFHEFNPGRCLPGQALSRETVLVWLQDFPLVLIPSQASAGHRRYGCNRPVERLYISARILSTQFTYSLHITAADAVVPPFGVVESNDGYRPGPQTKRAGNIHSYEGACALFTTVENGYTVVLPQGVTAKQRFGKRPRCGALSSSQFLLRCGYAAESLCDFGSKWHGDRSV